MEEMNVETLAGQREGWPASFGQSNPTSSLWRQFELDKSIILPGMTPRSKLLGKPSGVNSSESRGSPVCASHGSQGAESDLAGGFQLASFVESGRGAKRLWS